MLNPTGAATSGTPFASLLAGQSLSDLASLGLSQSVNLNARLATDVLAVRTPKPAPAIDRPLPDQVREPDDDTDDRAVGADDRATSAADRDDDTGAPRPHAAETTAGLAQPSAETADTRPLSLTRGDRPAAIEPHPSGTRHDVAARVATETARPQPDQAPQRPLEQSPTLLKAQVTEPQKPLTSQPNAALSARAAVTAQIAGDKSPANPSLDGGLINKASHGSLTAANTLAQHSHGQTAAANASARGHIRPQLNGGNTAAKAQVATSTVQPTTQTTAGVANARMPFSAGLTGSAQSGAQHSTPQFADLAPGSGNALTHTQEASRGPATPPAPRAHPPVPPRIVTNQVAVQIQKAVAQGTDRINIQLKPAELGRVEIRLDVAQDGRVSAVISVERQDTLELLQRDARTLHTTLQDAGLKTGSDSLNFELRQHGSAAGNDPNTESARGDGDQAAGEHEPAEATAQSGIITQDRIDIEI